jgi:hypothetical protein
MAQGISVQQCSPDSRISLLTRLPARQCFLQQFVIAPELPDDLFQLYDQVHRCLAHGPVFVAGHRALREQGRTPLPPKSP